MDRDIKKHFKKSDSILYHALLRCGELEPLNPREQKDYFYALCYDIIGQQLSGKAASTIFGRFEKLFPKGNITAKKILQLDEEQLRAVGMSYAKARFLKDLASKVLNKEVYLEKLVGMTDEAVVTELMKIKGVGQWTAEMFLMFSLGREDVFSVGDQGLKNAIKKLYGEVSREELLILTNKWSPYRTYACRILWQSLDTLT